MASITKRGKSYCVVYSYVNDKGQNKQKWETCHSYKEAQKKKAEIESSRTRGTFTAPSKQTIEEFLQDFVSLYGEKKRKIWDADTIRKALDACRDSKLYVAMNLSFARSLRLGEILGLTWEGEAGGTSEMQRSACGTIAFPGSKERPKAAAMRAHRGMHPEGADDGWRAASKNENSLPACATGYASASLLGNARCGGRRLPPLAAGYALRWGQRAAALWTLGWFKELCAKALFSVSA